MRRSGFTIAELLVSLTILSVLTLAVVLISSQLSAGYRLGSSHLELQGQARETVRRVTPFITSAVSAGQEAIYSPALGSSGPEVIFASSENWLDEPLPNFGDAGYPVYRVYRIRFDSQDLIMENLYSPAVEPRILARRLYDVEFTRPFAETVGVEVEVRGTVRSAVNQERDTVERLETLLQIPYYTAR